MIQQLIELDNTFVVDHISCTFRTASAK